MSRWDARGVELRRIILGLTLLMGISGWSATVFALARTQGERLNDYSAFRSFSGFIASHAASRIYDYEALARTQSFAHGCFFPYLYHPATLFLVWPLAHLPYWTGYFLWMSCGLGVYLLALGPCRPVIVAIAAAAAPSTVWVVLNGQNTLLAAGLFYGAFRLVRTRPVIAGVMIGLMAYKPQLGLLIPLALAASGQWRCIAAAALTVCAMILGSSAAFGWSIWLVWLQTAPHLWHLVDTNSSKIEFIMVTVAAMLHWLGSPQSIVAVLQGISTLGAAACVWWCFRRGTGPLQVAALAVAAFLATPYAFAYDLPLLTPAIFLIVLDRQARHDSFAFSEVILLTIAFLVPAMTLSKVFHILTVPVLVALLALIVSRLAAEHGRVGVGPVPQEAVMAR